MEILVKLNIIFGKSEIFIDGKELLNLSSFEVSQKLGELPIIKLKLIPDKIVIEGNIPDQCTKVIKNHKAKPKKKKDIRVVERISEVSDEELQWGSDPDEDDPDMNDPDIEASEETSKEFFHGVSFQTPKRLPDDHIPFLAQKPINNHKKS